MIKSTTTKATYKGVDIAVISENIGHGTMYACTNNTGRSSPPVKWFGTQREALAYEREVIDALLR